MTYIRNFNRFRKIFEQEQSTQTKEVKIGDFFEVIDQSTQKKHQMEIVGPKLADGTYDQTKDYVEVEIDQKGPYQIKKKGEGLFGGFQPQSGQMSGDLKVNTRLEKKGALKKFNVKAKGKNKLSYTTELNEPIWKGENYGKLWIPYVKDAMDKPEDFARILQYLENYNGQDAAVVKKILAKAKAMDQKNPGKNILKNRIFKLATDGKVGPFHSIIKGAMEEAVPEVKPKSEPKEEPRPEPKEEPKPQPKAQTEEEKYRRSGIAGERRTTEGGRGDWGG